MASKKAREIEQTAISEIALQIGEFGEAFAARAAAGGTGALDAIEDDWARMQAATEGSYRRMVGDLAGSVDERGMIAKKKPSGPRGG
jgi:hypothetical protein